MTHKTKVRQIRRLIDEVTELEVMKANDGMDLWNAADSGNEDLDGWIEILISDIEAVTK